MHNICIMKFITLLISLISTLRSIGRLIADRHFKSVNEEAQRCLRLRNLLQKINLLGTLLSAKR